MLAGFATDARTGHAWLVDDGDLTARHAYDRSQGFEHLRTVEIPDYRSGALFQRRARPAITPCFLPD